MCADRVGRVVLFVGSFGPGAAHAHGHRAPDGSVPAAQARQHGGSGSVAFARPAGIATFAATSVWCWVAATVVVLVANCAVRR